MELCAKVQIFATDIDETAIAQARAGFYADDIVAEVGEERLRAFFTTLQRPLAGVKGVAGDDRFCPSQHG